MTKGTKPHCHPPCKARVRGSTKDTQISVQKVLKKSLNAAINKAHKEGYKLVKQEFDISKKEYKKKRTELRKVRMSNFKHFNVSANSKAEERDINYIKFSYYRFPTHLKGIKKSRRRPVVADLFEHRRQ